MPLLFWQFPLQSKNKTERTSGNKLEKILQELIESHGGGAEGGPLSQFSEAWRGQLLLSTTMEEHGYSNSTTLFFRTRSSWVTLLTVNLGLIPSSEDSWPVACRLLKRTTGGLLHIHNVTSALPNTAINYASGKKSDREAWQIWADDTAKHITFLLKDITGAHWTTSIQHIEHVESYVPHVHHVVLDLACRPSWAEGMNTETLLYSSLHKHYTNSSLSPKPLNPPRCNWPC